MSAWYNEIDPYMAQWLRNLIAAGHIAPGIVDERSIEDVKPDELRGFTQCHFFAGAGVWSYALRRAGWADDRRIWTGSCPCQPFSAAGKGNGFDDERHLWPHFHYLIGQCLPPVVVGEQVASKAVDDWIDLVHTDVEALGYAFGSVPFPSAGVGAPHIRDRNYWVGHANDARLEGLGSGHQTSGGWIGTTRPTAPAGESLRMAHTGYDHDAGQEQASRAGQPQADRSTDQPGGHDDNCSLVRPGPTNGFWRDADWLGCRDEKWRPVEPGTFPLVDGSAGRVGRVRAGVETDTSLPRKDRGNRAGRLKGYGNAINAEAAVAFIECIFGEDAV